MAQCWRREAPTQHGTPGWAGSALPRSAAHIEAHIVPLCVAARRVGGATGPTWAFANSGNVPWPTPLATSDDLSLYSTAIIANEIMTATKPSSGRERGRGLTPRPVLPQPGLLRCAQGSWLPQPLHFGILHHAPLRSPSCAARLPGYLEGLEVYGMGRRGLAWVCAITCRQKYGRCPAAALGRGA